MRPKRYPYRINLWERRVYEFKNHEDDSIVDSFEYLVNLVTREVKVVS